MSPALQLYRLATGLLEPLVPILIARRARAGQEDAARRHERLGRTSTPRPPGPLVWLHGASVGEGVSLLPLVARLRELRPATTLLVTSGTVTSAAVLALRLPSGALHQFTPVDAPGAAGRFVAHWRPDAAVFVESEIWPNLLLATRRSGARTALLSARLSESSAARWRRSPASARALFGGFDRVCAQDDGAAKALRDLGARDDGRINLKLSGEVLAVDGAALAAARTAAAGRPVLLAASTHPGEDAIILDAFKALGSQARLVVVPRHPLRAFAVAALAHAQGLGVGVRSRGDAFGSEAVYVADTLGELGLWFRLCDAALIGGSLVEGPGGHNPLEAARLERTLLTGPHVEAWREVYADLTPAPVVVSDAKALSQAWRTVLANPYAGAAARAVLARRLAAQAQATLDRAVAAVLDLLGPASE